MVECLLSKRVALSTTTTTTTKKKKKERKKERREREHNFRLSGYSLSASCFFSPSACSFVPV
jgi:hypothetical protein